MSFSREPIETELKAFHPPLSKILDKLVKVEDPKILKSYKKSALKSHGKKIEAEDGFGRSRSPKERVPIKQSIINMKLLVGKEARDGQPI